MTTPSADVVAAARAAKAKYGVPASVQIAQWALESGWGSRTSGKNNCFGIKAVNGQPCTVVQTHEVIGGVRISKRCAFRDFDSLADAFDAHAKLLATASPYADARAQLPNVFAYADALGGGTFTRPRYATDPHYGDKLGEIIRGSNLTQYDRGPGALTGKASA